MGLEGSCWLFSILKESGISGGVGDGMVSTIEGSLRVSVGCRIGGCSGDDCSMSFTDSICSSKSS